MKKENIISVFHKKTISHRRQNAIAEVINIMISNAHIQVSSILDVGCGDGSISDNIGKLNQNKILLQGVEYIPRTISKIPVVQFDGINLPFDTGSFDVIIVCDVIHHIPSEEAIIQLLMECGRVAKYGVIIKDHPIENKFDRAFISVMDWIGNYGSGIPMPFKFPSRKEWQQIFSSAGLESKGRMEGPFGLHPWAIRYITESPFWSKPFHFIEILSAKTT